MPLSTLIEVLLSKVIAYKINCLFIILSFALSSCSTGKNVPKQIHKKEEKIIEKNTVKNASDVSKSKTKKVHWTSFIEHIAAIVVTSIVILGNMLDTDEK